MKVNMKRNSLEGSKPMKLQKKRIKGYDKLSAASKEGFWAVYKSQATYTLSTVHELHIWSKTNKCACKVQTKKHLENRILNVLTTDLSALTF